MSGPGAVGRNVARLRVQRGLTQAELAERAGVAQATISHLEIGARTDAKGRVIVALAGALGVTTDALLRDDAERG